MRTAESECPFSELLWRSQDDLDLLTDEELVVLEEHLEEEPPCQVCHSEMPNNALLLTAIKEVTRKQGK